MGKVDEEPGFVPPAPDAVARDLAPLAVDAPPVLRFAPSPNGRLHPGHAYSALLNRRLADAHGGRMLIRIEDLDETRCTSALERAALADLAATGVASDGPVMRQSERGEAYAAALRGLRARGLLYPTHLSRGAIRRFVAEREAGGRIWPRDPDGAPHYPRGADVGPDESARLIADGAPHGLRLDMTRAAPEAGPLSWDEDGCGGLGRTDSIAADPTRWGDPQLARVEGGRLRAAYHLAVVVDDAAQGITHVVRGRDLREATDLHRLLQALLGLPTPSYRHHALVLAPDGGKLSKSRGDAGLAAYGPGIAERLGFGPFDERT